MEALKERDELRRLAEEQKGKNEDSKPVLEADAVMTETNNQQAEVTEN